MDTENIKQQLRQQAIQNAHKQGITYTETPSWISSISWWIGGISALITFFVVLGTVDQGQALLAFLAAPFYGLVFKGLSYAVLYGIHCGGKYAKQGAVAATKEGSRLLDNATSTIAKKITIAVERGKTEAKIEQEKQKLNEQMTDLELQYLRKRVEELEKRVDNK